MDGPDELLRKYGSPRLRRLVRRASIWALAGFGGVLIILMVIFHRVTASEAWVDHMHGVRLAIEETMAALATAEAAQRRFLIDRDEAALDPYRLARDRALRRAEALAGLAETPVEQQERAIRLRKLIERRIGYLDPAILLARTSDESAALRQLNTREGLDLAAEARRLASEMQQVAGAALDARQATVVVLRWYFRAAVIGLGLGLAAFWGIMFRQVHQAAHRERLLRDDLLLLLNERTALLREINHRVGNSLMTVSALVDMQARAFSDATLREAFDRTRARIAAVGQVHRRLQQSETITSLDFADYLRALCQDLNQSLVMDGCRVEVEAEPAALPVEAVVPLGLIVNELVTNAVRHGYGPGVRGKIAVRFERAGPGVRLCVQDWGRGLPTQTETTAIIGLGMSIVRALAAQLDGELSIQSHGGTTVCLTAPLLELESARLAA